MCDHLRPPAQFKFWRHLLFCETSYLDIVISSVFISDVVLRLERGTSWKKVTVEIVHGPKPELAGALLQFTEQGMREVSSVV